MVNLLICSGNLIVTGITMVYYIVHRVFDVNVIIMCFVMFYLFIKKSNSEVPSKCMYT